ncbi:MAG TPA: BTAD domain-containing putative transcriptional regulator [Pseudonocardiaceae bacterium]|nr:BTAD domain-containing putative transcriptional regulator [Pseudonocardiaceae bacterium]
MLEIFLLGPTEARISGDNVSLAPLERNLLAVLALSTGSVISTERIVCCLWGDRHPMAPRSRVQGLVSSLRRKVGDAVVTRHPGYLLDSARVTIDLDECAHLARQARMATTRDGAVQYLRKALDLWRGESLDGVSAPGIEVDRIRLEELRLGLLEERFAAELELGNHAELVAELAPTVAAHPLRERLAGQLMLALYRCSRQADALRTYQALRHRLAEELGSDPCPDLRDLHASILRGDRPDRPGRRQRPQPLRQPVARPRPAQLPASVAHFTGRDGELAALTRALGHPPQEPSVLLVSGPGGLGKTALVVRWARAIADRYRDGQLFVDLRGRVPGKALSAAAALGTVLRSLGVPKDDLPATVDERAALYRTLVSGRCLLLVADDAGSVNQLLPLVPPTMESQLVATSRRRLAAMSTHHAIHRMVLEPLTPAGTRELLVRIVGSARMHDPAAARMVNWCGGWPLVIQHVGTKLAARPGQPLASFVAELDELAEDLVLDDDPRSVRAALASAHKALSPAAAHLFGRLGLCSSSAITLRLTAATSDFSVRQLHRLFDELTAVHLVVEDGPGRYRIHDIVRRFARRCGAELIDRDAVDEWYASGLWSASAAWRKSIEYEATSKPAL